MGAVLYGTLVMLPLFLQQLMGYPALQSGLTVSPRGLGSLLLLPLIGRLANVIDNRMMLVTGFLLLGISTLMLGHLNLMISMGSVITPNFISGMALALIFVPLTTMAMGKLRNEQIGNASGIYNLMRNLGGGIGISAVATLLARGAQVHQVNLVSHLTPYDPQFMARLTQLQHVFGAQFDPVTAGRMANGAIYGTLLRQASLLAFVDNFRLYGFLCLLCIPLVLMFKRVRLHGGPPGAH